VAPAVPFPTGQVAVQPMQHCCAAQPRSTHRCTSPEPAPAAACTACTACSPKGSPSCGPSWRMVRARRRAGACSARPPPPANVARPPTRYTADCAARGVRVSKCFFVCVWGGGGRGVAEGEPHSSKHSGKILALDHIKRAGQGETQSARSLSTLVAGLLS
jgi:hypothetical protein